MNEHSDTQRAIQHDLSADDAAPRSEQRLVVVQDEMQASMVCALLEANGITSHQRRTAGAGVDWGLINVGMSGFREVLVSSDQLGEARQLLETIELEQAAEDAGAVDSTRGDVLDEGHSEIAQDDEHRLLDGMRRLRHGYALIVVLLFGVPIAIGIYYQLAVAARSVTG